MSDYKVGDVVKLKKLEDIGPLNEGVYVDDMKIYFDSEAVISDISYKYFKIKNSSWNFDFEWIDYLVDSKIVEDKKMPFTEKSEEQDLVDGLRAIMSEFDKVCERLEELCVDVELVRSDNGHTVNARKITTIEL